MIVTWKDETGAQHWGDDTSKAYRKHLENKPVEKAAEKPAAAKPVVVTPTVDEAKRK